MAERQATPMGRRLHELVDSGAADLPRPGTGATRRRWAALARVAAEDLALAKLFEGHTDALAILAELGADDLCERGQVWETWAAEPPFARVQLTRRPGGVSITGRKAWCSGADVATHGLLTGWDENDRQCLVAVELGDPRVGVTTAGWQAVGMAAAASGDVEFDAAPAVEVGKPGDYVRRPGFWQGGCGIAACWYGGALPLATAVVELCARRPDPHALAHLGAIDAALAATRALLAEAADWIDQQPLDSAKLWALRTRASAEATALEVHLRAGRAVGAAPLCRDAAMARRYADLPVYIRQSHAERDLAELGETLAADLPAAEEGWQL